MEIPNSQNVGGLINRITELFKNPKSFLNSAKNDGENKSTLFSRFYLPLFLVTFAVHLVIGILFAIIGFSAYFPRVLGLHAFPIGTILIGSVLYSILYAILNIALIYIMSTIINALAASFGGKQNIDNAFKVTVYASVPALLSYLVNYLPVIGILAGLAGLVFSIYFLYLGLQILMESPSDKVVGYTVIVVIIEIAIAVVFMFLIVGLIINSLLFRSLYF
jgi:hypothetical protein